MAGSAYTVSQLGDPMSTSCREKLREMCAFSHASSAVGSPRTRQYPTASACAVEFRNMVPDPLGSFGWFASRTAPGGSTNSPRIAFASAAARCSGVPDGRSLTVGVPEDLAARGAYVSPPQPTASTAPTMRRNGPVFLSLTPLRRQVSQRRFHAASYGTEIPDSLPLSASATASRPACRRPSRPEPGEGPGVGRVRSG